MQEFDDSFNFAIGFTDRPFDDFALRYVSIRADMNEIVMDPFGWVTTKIELGQCTLEDLKKLGMSEEMAVN